MIRLFDPGDELILTISGEGKHPEYDGVTIGFPGRVHITPVDCNRFDFGKPGGGGLGFAIDLENSLDIVVSDSDEVDAEPLQEPLIHHYVLLMRKVLGFTFGLRIKCSMADVMQLHSGLGSSIALACGCVQGINVLCGAPLSHEEVRRLIGDNFAEVCQGRLSRGLETGVGSAVILRGGLAFVGDEIVTLYSSRNLDGIPVVLVRPGAPRPDSDQPESLDMLNRSLLLDASYRYVRAYRIVMDIIPALTRGDLKALGDVIWDFQFSGTHLSMVQGRFDLGLELLRIMMLLRRAGTPIVGMSSVGPTIYAVSKDPAPVIDLVTSEGITHILTKVSSKGTRIIEHM